MMSEWSNQTLKDGLFMYPVAVIGFEQEEYTANEGDLFVEVCLVLFQPADISSLSDTLVFVEAESISDTAEGMKAVLNCLIGQLA